MKNTLIIALVCLVAVAVGAWLFWEGSDHPLSSPSLHGPVAYLTLSEGQNAGSITTRTNYRIKSQEEFAALWEMIHSPNTPALPPVDFTKNEVLAIFDGTHASGGYGVAIASIENKELSRHVSIVRIVPGEDCVTTPVITSPYSIVAVPRSGLPITREEITRTVSCN